MRESGYYPPGAEFDPSAPWNEVSVPEKEFDVTCTQVLSKTVGVWTDNYIPYCDEGSDDGIGYHDEWEDTSDTDWKKEYSRNHLTPLQLIEKFKERLMEELKQVEKWPEDEKYPYVKRQKIRELKDLIENCSDWEEDEMEVNL